MTSEKPWHTSFDKLLTQMVSRWHGRVSGLDEKSLGEAFVYPVFMGELQGYKFTVEISEYPRVSKHPSAIEGMDNVEYLRIHVTVLNEHNIQVTHETFADRLGKFFHLEHEVETGNKEFDRHFFIKLRSDKDKNFLSNETIQALIYELEPFIILEIAPSGIHWSQMINNKEQLGIEKVEGYVSRLLKLADHTRAM
jgi:hypothetical protein